MGGFVQEGCGQARWDVGLRIAKGLYNSIPPFPFVPITFESSRMSYIGHLYMHSEKYSQ